MGDHRLALGTCDTAVLSQATTSYSSAQLFTSSVPGVVLTGPSNVESMAFFPIKMRKIDHSELLARELCMCRCLWYGDLCSQIELLEFENNYTCYGFADNSVVDTDSLSQYIVVASL